MTPSIDTYLLEEHSDLISSRSHLKRRSPGHFWRGRPNKNKKNNNNNKMSSDMRLVPDKKYANIHGQVFKTSRKFNVS